MSSDNMVQRLPAALTSATLGFLLFVCLPVPVNAAKSKPLESTANTDDVIVAPVIIDGRVLFQVRGISAFPANRRAEAIAERIRRIAANHAISAKTLSVTEVDKRSRIAADDQLVLMVLNEDAELERLDRNVLATAYVQRIGEAIEAYRYNRSATYLAKSALFAIAASVVLVLFLWLGGRAMRRLDTMLERRLKAKLEEVETHSLRLVSAANLWRMLQGLRGMVWTVAMLVAVIAWLDFVLQLFPWTRWFGIRLLDLLVEPLRAVGEGLLTIIPDLLFLAILVVVTRYVLKAIRLLFDGIAQGRVTVAAFDAEWAWPTYRLVRLFVVVLAVVVAYPYIPGSDSDAFKGISVFIGLVFSLGSSSVIGNMIAGYSLTYRRAFRVGDRIRVNEHVGDVVEMRLLVTRIRTPKNEEVVIPNSIVLNTNVVNYSTQAREGKLILHASVGIGYETPWRQVEAMLLEAAARTEGLLKEPRPFVLQKALGDFAVTYEINACCADAQAMNNLYSRLHQNILDVFNEYGVQIMTPAYEGDPAQPKLVPKDQWYAAPATAPDKSSA